MYKPLYKEILAQLLGSNKEKGELDARKETNLKTEETYCKVET